MKKLMILILLIAVQRVSAETGCLADYSWDDCLVKRGAVVGRTLEDTESAWDYRVQGKLTDLQALIEGDRALLISRPLKAHIISTAFKPLYRVRVHLTLTEVWIHCSQLECTKESDSKEGTGKGGRQREKEQSDYTTLLLRPAGPQ